jgi:hypothetical protein
VRRTFIFTLGDVTIPFKALIINKKKVNELSFKNMRSLLICPQHSTPFISTADMMLYHQNFYDYSWGAIN